MKAIGQEDFFTLPRDKCRTLKMVQNDVLLDSMLH